MGFPCLPAFTTFGVVAESPGEQARGDATGESGVEEGVLLGEVGDAEQPDIEDRFLLPGTAFGAEALLFASLPLALAAALGFFAAAWAGGVAK